MYILIGILGLGIGSFLNVVIYRLPKGLSLLGPRSLCPSCNSVIRCYDNIPVLSFVLLRRKCRQCGALISWRYPLVELLTALMLIVMAVRYGWGIEFLKFSVLCLVLLPISFIDWDEKIIPNRLTFSGFIAGIAITLIFQIELWLSMLLGMTAGGLFMIGLMVLGKLIFKKDAMGMGDVKFIIMIGTYVGVAGVFISIYLAAVTALVILAIPLILKKIKFGDQIPFGPFLAIGTIVYLLVGTDLIHWYRNLVMG
ncbi:prepilin peptidase [bacterium]|nr:prepilin peptidase [bacterium]